MFAKRCLRQASSSNRTQDFKKSREREQNDHADKKRLTSKSKQRQRNTQHGTTGTQTNCKRERLCIKEASISIELNLSERRQRDNTLNKSRDRKLFDKSALKITSIRRDWQEETNSNKTKTWILEEQLQLEQLIMVDLTSCHGKRRTESRERK